MNGLSQSLCTPEYQNTCMGTFSRVCVFKLNPTELPVSSCIFIIAGKEFVLLHLTARTTATALAAQPCDSSPGFCCTRKGKYSFQVIDSKHGSRCSLEVCRTSAFITKLFSYIYLQSN